MRHNEYRDGNVNVLKSSFVILSKSFYCYIIKVYVNNISHNID